MNEAPKVSFIVVTYNGREHVRRCLTSLYKHTRDIDFEVVVVDNASLDGTADMIAAEFSNVHLVRRTTNAGFAAGVNEGIKHAHEGSLFVLNPDTELTANILPSMVSYLAEHRDIGLLAPKLLDREGSVQLSCRTFPGYRTALFNRYSLLTRIFPRSGASRRYLMTDFDHNAVVDVDWVSGAAWLLPRTTIETVGKLDDAYFWSIEDVDYCQRIHRSGLRVVYFPRASIIHHIGGSSSTARSRATIARHRGMWRYYSKYVRPRNVLMRFVSDFAVASGITLRCAAQLAVGGFAKRRI